MLPISDFARFALYTEVLYDEENEKYLRMFNMFGTFEECKDYAIELLNEGNGDRYVVMRWKGYDYNPQTSQQIPVVTLIRDDNNNIIVIV